MPRQEMCEEDKMQADDFGWFDAGASLMSDR